ncbi:hypothetical protein V6N13_064196 [Hibiscus sabdariffa]|uniref:Uncharacterized protein n=2 Tax=Hibiscus sabdariffa TaxID=183260 RepID=A0ABR2B2D3_9ROSI
MLPAKRSLHGACENAEISHAVCSMRPVSDATLHGPPAMELHHPTWTGRELQICCRLLELSTFSTSEIKKSKILVS